MIDKDDMIICPNCGGNMSEDAADPSLVRCEGCGHTISSDEAKTLGREDEE